VSTSSDTHDQMDTVRMGSIPPHHCHSGLHYYIHLEEDDHWIGRPQPPPSLTSELTVRIKESTSLGCITYQIGPSYFWVVINHNNIRIKNLNRDIDGDVVDSHTHTHPSHSQKSYLSLFHFPLLQYPIPRIYTEGTQKFGRFTTNHVFFSYGYPILILLYGSLLIRTTSGPRCDQ
jgi:hypothetical protein